MMKGESAPVRKWRRNATGRVQVRVNSAALARINAEATKKGLPRDMLIGSIIHKYAHKR